MKYKVEITAEHIDASVIIEVEAESEELAIKSANKKFWTDYCRMYNQPEDMWEDAMGGGVNTAKIIIPNPLELEFKSCTRLNIMHDFKVVVDSIETYNEVFTALTDLNAVYKPTDNYPMPEAQDKLKMVSILWCVEDIDMIFEGRDEKCPLTAKQKAEILNDLDFSDYTWNCMRQDLVESIEAYMRDNSITVESTVE